MSYRKVYFRIRTGCYNSGWSSDADRAAFKEESRRLFQDLGWAVTLGSNGGCDTVAKDQQDLYLHPSSFSGVLEEANIQPLQEQLSKAKTFRCYHVDCYEEYQDLSDEAYRAELEGRNKIGNQFVAEVMDELLQKGWLVAGKTSHGEGIRTATNKERGVPRQPTEQVDGQITMESQKHTASKKRKPPDPSR